jgi:hypothetical protein
MILNSPYISGSLTVTNLSGSGVRYLMTSASGLLISQTADAAIKNTYTASATAGQTVFPVTNGYSTGLVDVYLNGTKLASSDYSDADGLNITLVTGSDAGDLLEFVKYSPALGVTNNALRQLTTFTSSEGQTVYSASYTPGLLDVYYNGSRLTPAEYTANNGTFITLATGSVAGDIVDLLVYSYQVGAFSGVGGTGVANQVAYWDTTNSITGSPNFTVSGSTLAVTGSFTVITGSAAEFTVNPTGVRIGNVSTDTHTITGSVNMSGSFSTIGTITAQTLVVQTVTSSVSFITGSTRFGTLNSNTHVFTGSMSVTGGLVDINKDGQSLRIFPATSSGSARIQMQNSGSGGVAGANAIIAVESSTGADQFTGTSPFSFVIGTATQKAFHLGANSAVVMTITGSNVGIGTNIPSSKVTIIRDSPFNTGDQAIRIRAIDGDGYNLWMGASTNGYATIQSYRDEVGGATLLLNPLNGGKVYIGASSIANAGTVLSVIGTNNSDPLSRFYLNAASTQTRPAIRIDKYDNTSTTAQVFIDFTINQQASGNGSITANGASQATFTTWSDRRLKENITDLPNQLSNIIALRPVEFDYKDGSGHQIGFIAQEVQEVYPDIVSENSEGYLTISGLGKMESRLVKALQEANAKITALEEKLERNNIQ